MAASSSAKCSIHPHEEQSSCSGPGEEGRADNAQTNRQPLRTKYNPTTNLERGEDNFLGHLLYILITTHSKR